MNRSSVLIAAILSGVLLIWGTPYLYLRSAHSLSGTFATAPVSWRQINYDQHYPGLTLLRLIHLPLGWMDQKLTGVEITLRKNDFHGDRDNYGREAFN